MNCPRRSGFPHGVAWGSPVDTGSMRRLLTAAALASALLLTPAAAAQAHDRPVRFATYNLSLNRPAEGLLREHLANPDVDDVFRRQAHNVAEVIQRARPDVVLLNEFDYDPEAARLFERNFLAVSQNGAPAQRYPYRYVAPSNTGIASGFDLNNNGVIDTTPGDQAYGDDSYGFGLFPGQYGMVVYSKYPIDLKSVRTFQLFKWKDMPGNLIPADFYSPAARDVLRLSSKSHWDVPVRIHGRTVHFLVSHPTPPTFDGPEDRNGRRNHDEIRFWSDYVKSARYIYDDRGHRGGLKPGQAFVIAGDQNADPNDGDSYDSAVHQLLDNRLINSRTTPSSAGAAEAATLQGGANATHKGNPKYDTADFADTAPGNLRADYVLPRVGLRVKGSGVFWPVQADPLSRLSGVYDPVWAPVNGFPTSDHRLVWLDLSV
ncbi:endonuclease/exonuclease/phosphatase family protein [Actinoplanes bogorensis]|uniref:Endonuclease/exonuclease/phosphatase family protein n=2 Tax=Paractinoplanes bogorensis TaxID=1610840 RepID=A0ABS5YZY8_9ACTN|nr:endonuclease/exonuclease/phosphatase family protein [Actinoplanes bogorensis]